MLAKDAAKPFWNTTKQGTRQMLCCVAAHDKEYDKDGLCRVLYRKSTAKVAHEYSTGVRE
jgi:hypothetical protein